jgi:hypothetical protein
MSAPFKRPAQFTSPVQFHSYQDRNSLDVYAGSITGQRYTYTFENFFHPFVGDLIRQLNQKSLDGLFDPDFHAGLGGPDVVGPDSFFKAFPVYTKPSDSSDAQRRLTGVEGFPLKMDVSVSGPYANYNWELLFHVPLAIAIHLGKNQRFSDAQRWFHFIFDPTRNDTTPTPQRFWRFLAFRKLGRGKPIDELLALLSKPNPTQDEMKLRNEILSGFEAIKNKPFQPHVVARTRQVSYQYQVVMKYLDNLIAWGDSLFRQDTRESINEAMQLYVLAANILGPKPQRIPPPGNVKPKNFAQLRQLPRDALGNALVDLESKFPFNLNLPTSATASTQSPLFGIGRALYFCIPQNDKLLGYWDTVADRLFKIRNCMNIEGLVRQLALFDPPIDPAVLVSATAAGVDVGTALTGLQQPVGLLRAPILIQKALELCDQVRNLGINLLAAIEKRDGERIALLRQTHETTIQQMQQDVRFLQWKQAEEATEALIRSRPALLERYRFYLRLLGQTPDANAPDTFVLDRRELTEANFQEINAKLVEQYTRPIAGLAYPPLRMTSSGASSGSPTGNLYLTSSEDAELNVHLPKARDERFRSSSLHTIASVLTFIPDFDVKIAPLGIGLDSKVFGGVKLSDALKIAAEIKMTEATFEQDQAGIAARTASYERRADDWLLQANLVARELAQVGRHIIGSLIAEQVSRHEYLNNRKQIGLTQEVDRFLRDKYTNEAFYAWMQGETSRLYYEHYRFAFDTARKAERAIKQELMLPEMDSKDYIKFNYWDAGRQGLLSADSLYFDIKRMELAYHELNKREYELTKHISLLQVDPYALLQLRATGRCSVQLPEELFDVDGPGHYFRRIKTVALSIPCTTGPYTGVNCRLTLVKSSIRKNAQLKDGKYKRAGAEDDRFINYFGSLQSVVTSSGQNDSGLFETNLRDDRFLPFEGAGAAYSEWQIELPSNPSKDELAQFDYGTISDVILHMRFTAREGGGPLRDGSIAGINELIKSKGAARLFSVKQEFPGEWSRFAPTSSIAATDTVYAASGSSSADAAAEFLLKIELRPQHYPFWSQPLLNRAKIRQLDIVADAAFKFKESDGMKPAVKDDMIGSYRYRLAQVPSDPVGPLNLTFDNNSMKNLWLLVTWSVTG